MLPDVSSPGEWLHPTTVTAVAKHLLANMRFDQPLATLEADITAALTRSDLVELEWVSTVETACELHGTYSSPPPRIRLSRQQGAARANFTAAHEFGHHLQRHDDEWAMDVLAELRRAHTTLSRHVEEAVSDRVAVLLLMPDHIVEQAWTGELTPAFVRSLTRDGLVSRQAAAMRASAWAQESDPDAVIVIADPATGAVLFSKASENSRLVPPPTWTVQPDFRALTVGPEGRRGATEGFLYSTNRSRADIAYDWCWDADGRYLFVIARPTYRFGTPQWDVDVVECGSLSCGSTFSRTDAVFCRMCLAHKCPDCGTCNCESRRGTTCSRCGMEMSLRESQRGTAHEECPF